MITWKPELRPRAAAAAVAAGYALVGGAWIVLSDLLLGTAVGTDFREVILQTGKGSAYVAITGLLLFLLLDRLFKSLAVRMQGAQVAAERFHRAERAADLAHWSLDTDTATFTWSEGASAIFGVPYSDLPATQENLARFLSDEDHAQLRANLAAPAIPGPTARVTPYRIHTAGGETRNVVSYVEPQAEPTQVRRAAVDGILQDVTRLRAAEDEAARAQYLLQRAIDTIEASIAILDERGVVVSVNDGWRRFARENGASPDVGIGSDYVAVTRVAADSGDADARAVLEGLEAIRAGRVPYFQHTYPCHSPDVERWFQVSMTAFASSGLEQIVLFHTDVTAEHSARVMLERQARYDLTSGLPNIVEFRERLGRHIVEAEVRGWPVALLLVGIDGMDEIVETFGYDFAEEITQQVAAVVAGYRDLSDAARIGSSEFASIAAPGDVAGAVAAAHGMLEVLAQPLHVGSQEFGISASIGVAVYPGHGQDVEALIQRATIALHQAQRFGQSVRTYRPEIDSENRENLELFGGLRRAIERDELVVHYQPIVDLRDGSVRSLEALVRWQHPERGLLQPGAFISLVERTGLIHEFTTKVVEIVARQLFQWKHEGGTAAPRVSINLSGRDVQDTRLPDRLQATLATWGVEPHEVAFEITEQALIHDHVQAAGTLQRLRDIGHTLLVDDFGTGYSGLQYLRHLPVSVIKIDRSFVSAVHESGRDASIVGTIIDLASALDLEVIAEGIESPEVAVALTGRGCQMGQGFLFSRPLPPPEIAAWLQHYEAAQRE